MRLTIIVIIYTLLNAVLYSQLMLWISKFKNLPGNGIIKIVISVMYFICFISVIIGFFLKPSKVQKTMQRVANYFMGVLFYIIFIACFSVLLQVVLIYGFNINRKFFYTNWYLGIFGIVFFILILTISIYGNLHAKKIKVKHYNIETTKDSKLSSLRIALVADFHLGYSVGYKMMEQMKDIINNEDVDIVLIAGDIFDNSCDCVDDISKIKKSLASIKSKYGIYSVFGNHDINEKLFSGFSTKSVKKVYRDKNMDKILKEANIKPIYDEVVKIEDFYIIGRKDYEKTGEIDNLRIRLTELMKKVNENKFIIVLEHQPRNLVKIAKHPVDLHLAGHTHAGQYFPLNIGTRLVWKNHYGIKKFGNMYSVVTSGIGVYGPNMRVGTNSEVVIIDVLFNKK